MIINALTLAEQEYEQPFNEIVEGFAADGHPAHRIADILHVDLPALNHYIADQNITITSSAGGFDEVAHGEAWRKNVSNARRHNASAPQITFNGFTGTYIDWEERTGIPRDAIRKRINRGWDIARALTTNPMDRHQVIEHATHAAIQSRRTR